MSIAPETAITPQSPYNFLPQTANVRGAAAPDWLADRQADLLPVPCYHLAFTLPVPIAAISACSHPSEHRHHRPHTAPRGEIPIAHGTPPQLPPLRLSTPAHKHVPEPATWIGRGEANADRRKHCDRRKCDPEGACDRLAQCQPVTCRDHVERRRPVLDDLEKFLAIAGACRRQHGKEHRADDRRAPSPTPSSGRVGRWPRRRIRLAADCTVSCTTAMTDPMKKVMSPSNRAELDHAQMACRQ